LLFHFPMRYEDRRHFAPLGRVQPGQTVCSTGTIVGAAVDRSPKRGMQLTKVVIRDATGTAELVFFNHPWLERIFNKMRGQALSVSGLAAYGPRGISFQTPEWEPLAGDGDALHVQRIVPIHPSTEGLSPKQLRTFVHAALERYADAVPDLLPQRLREAEALAPMGPAIRQIHFPDSPEALERA